MSTTISPKQSPGTLRPPEAAIGGRIFWRYLSVFILFHVIALLACLPYFFSWTGVILVSVGNYFFGSMGINVGYHRLLTHRSFACPKWLERLFVLFGVCSLQDSPGRWVAIHRMHHQNSDEQPDPHSPFVSLLWGHVGWLVVENRQIATLDTFAKYAPDVFRDRFYRSLHRKNLWVGLYVLHALIFAAISYLVAWLVTDTVSEMIRFGGSLVVWGIVVRTVYVWHITWAVNSFAHRWGYRNYKTGEESRNNWYVALLTNGEGWHNNHHADPRAASHGHRWWEIDLTYLTLRLLQMVGLVWDVQQVRVPAHVRFPSEESAPSTSVPQQSASADPSTTEQTSSEEKLIQATEPVSSEPPP